MQLHPRFSPAVVQYSAVVDLHDDNVWVEESVGGGVDCQARRSDIGVPVRGDGEVTVVVAASPLEEPRKYTVALKRRAGTDTHLQALDLIGAGLRLVPSFHAETLGYSVVMGEDAAGEVVLSCSPTDMGQGMRILLESKQPEQDAMGGRGAVRAAELPILLAQVPFRRRNFTLGQISVEATKTILLVPDADADDKRHLPLPLRIRVQVWPADRAVAASHGHEGTPGRVYSISLQAPAVHEHHRPKAAEHHSRGPHHAAQAEQVEDHTAGGAAEHSGWASTIKALLFPVVATALLGLVLAFVVRDAPSMPKPTKQSQSSHREDDTARGRAENEVEMAFNRARGTPIIDVVDSWAAGRRLAD